MSEHSLDTSTPSGLFLSTALMGLMAGSANSIPFSGKYIFQTAATHTSDFDNDAALAGGTFNATNADNNAVAELDNFCAQQIPGGMPAGPYRALVGILTLRDQSVGWPFSPGVDYYRPDGVKIFTTDANSQLDFSSGATLSATFTTSTNYRTGIDASTYPWTTYGTGTTAGGCSGFTACTSSGSYSAWYGYTTTNAGSLSYSNSSCNCLQPTAILCVEQ